jgi:RNA polymerase sigma-70 factor (ECF subfamily)
MSEMSAPEMSAAEMSAPAHDLDEALMVAVAAGDGDAFARLAGRHMGRAVSLAERLTGSAFDADEVAQDAFLRVWRHAARFDPRRARFTTWLYRIVVNLALDRLARERRRQVFWHPIEAAAGLADGALDALEQIAGREDAARLDSAMAGLPARQRAAVALFHQEGLSVREAAEVLGIGETACESLLARARRSLKAALAAGSS